MKKILALFLAVTAAVDARGAAVTSSSLEWLADTSPAIGVYNVTSAESRPSGAGAHYAFDLKFREALKGTPPATLQVTYDDFYYLEKGKRVRKDDKFLVFFRVDKNGLSHPAQVISLAQPGGVLDTPMALAMNAKVEVLTDGAAVLRTVRERMAAHPGTLLVVESRDWGVEITDTAAFKGIMYGDSYRLMLPAEERALFIARQDVRDLVAEAMDYYQVKHIVPAGSIAELVAEISKHDMTAERKSRLNSAGQFLDPWGTPYRIDVSNPKFPWAYSCGPDKKDDGGAPGSDDIVSW
ncbi:MAG TPA: hypothetical protein VG733_14045 [Chthoniobacteraceae bacterium]|nr:hypothetical protein [Chthoniobacteraceae bacterium]